MAARSLSDVDPFDWNVEEVISVLSDYLRDEDKTALRAHNVDGHTLLVTVSLENLRTELGIRYLNPRGRIMEVIASLRRRSLRLPLLENQLRYHFTPEHVNAVGLAPQLDEPLKLPPDWETQDMSPEFGGDVMTPEAAVHEMNGGMAEERQEQEARQENNQPAAHGDDHMDIDLEDDLLLQVDPTNHVEEGKMSEGDGDQTVQPLQPSLSAPAIVEQPLGSKFIRSAQTALLRPVEKAVSPPKAASPTPTARPESIIRRRLLPLRAERLETLLYTDEVGKDISFDSDEDDEFVLIRNQQQYPGMELYVNRCIRHLLGVNGQIIEDWDLGLATGAASTQFVRTQHNGRLRVAVKHYNGEAYLRKHEKQSFTVFDFESQGHVRAHRENSDTLSLPWPPNPIQHQGASSVQIVRHADSEVVPKLDPNSGGEFHFLAKWVNMDGADNAVPLWGESGDEGEYDATVWKEIEDERGPKEKVVSKRRTIAAINVAEVEHAIDEAILELVRRWKLVKMPVLEARKAYGIWMRAEKEKNRKRSISRAEKRIQALEERVAVMRSEFLKTSYPRKDLACKYAKGSLGVTIDEMEHNRWVIAVLRRPNEPTRPLPVARKSNRRGGGEDDGTEGDGNEAEENLGSDTGKELTSDDEMGDFVVQDELMPIEIDRDVDDDDIDILGARRRSRPLNGGDDAVDDSVVQGEPVPIGMDHGLDDDDDSDIVGPRRRGRPLNGGGDAAVKIKEETQAVVMKPGDVTPFVNSVATPANASSQQPRIFIDLTSPCPSPKRSFENASLGVASKSTNPPKPPFVGNKTQNQRPRDSPSLPRLSVDDARYNALREVCVKGDDTLNWQLKERLSEMKGNYLPGWFEGVRKHLKILHQNIDGNEHEVFLQRSVCRLYIVWRFLEPAATSTQRVSKAQLKELDDQAAFKRFIRDLDRILTTMLELSSATGLNPSEPPEEMGIDGDDNFAGDSQLHPRKRGSSSMDDNRHGGIPPGPPRRRLRKTVVEDKATTKTQNEMHSVHKNLAKRRQALERTGALNEGKVVINFGHFKKYQDIEIRTDIAKHLKPHQIKGIQFLWTTLVEAAHKNGKCTGALLAHTMGLGKTLQVITFLYTLAEAGASECKRDQIPSVLRESKTLILCPPTLIDNWVDEFHTWLPFDKGPQPKLSEEFIGKIYHVSSAIDPDERLKSMKEWNQNGGILLIGYAMFREYIFRSGDSETIDILLKGPNIIVADEAHSLKNKVSQLSQAASLFRSNSRIAMTGSPISNHLSEYYAMIHWIHPDYLGTENSFKSKYILPITDGLFCDSTVAEKRESLKMLQVLKSNLKSLVSRADIDVIMSEMPPKTEFMLSLPLTGLQKKMYSKFVADRELMTSSMTFFDIIHLLSLICSHPILFVKCLEARSSKKEGDQEKIRLHKKALPPLEQQEDEEDIVGDQSGGEGQVIVSNVSQLTSWARPMLDAAMGDSFERSYRLLAFRDIVMFSVALGDKVLVFSHSILTLDLLETVVENTKVNGRNLKWSRLDGKTAMGARQQSTKDFNSGDCDVFLISTQAGGLGLNLPGANRVIIFDYKWTPMSEQQAVGRAYRLGQKRHVYVYRFHAGGTFENSLWNTSQYKTQLQSRVVDRKAPMREAYRNGKEQFHPPATIVKQDLQEFMGKDEVLDRMLKEKDYVYDVSYTETFRPDHEDTLTPEEYRETELILEREQAERQKANSHFLTQMAGPSAMAPNTLVPSQRPVLGIPVSAANTNPTAPTLMAPVTVPSHLSPVIPNSNMGVQNSNLNVPNSNPDNSPGANRFGFKFGPGSLPRVFRGPR